MPVTNAQFRAAITSVGWTRNFLHLDPIPRHWTIRQSRSEPKNTAVKVKDRIKWWNIVPGDQVRLRGDPEGTIHEVDKVNKFNNRVYLKREVQRESNPSPLKGGFNTSKSVPYSRCQLLLGRYEFPPTEDSFQPRLLPVFAARLGTSKPFWAQNVGRWQWNRYAVATIPRLPDLIPGEKERTLIPWPKAEKPRIPDPTPYDTTQDAVTEVTYMPPKLPAYGGVKIVIPSRPSEHAYIRLLMKPEKYAYDPSQPVEVHLVKELSNPHSRAKKQARWKALQEHKRALLKEYTKAELKDLKGRTRREARAEGTWKWRVKLAEEHKAELLRRSKNRGAEARLLRKRVRKARKELKQRERLRNLVLEEAPNQVVPPTEIPA
ncbi:predicted protein [Sparassis crispa]|uniref:KOW domain-containing protein n=1 Tax=Sparassis crispa TaxID=139825 RepID=A0A401GAF0_9APHY|nr:predicted protein [Sparassis crispa]GBE79142.1 predicted protein [Sparassis crispa]